MPDLITTILTTAIEHAPGTTAVVAAYKAAQPFLVKILGPGADEIGEIGRDYIKGRRAKNAERTLADADKLLADTGREPQEVPLNVAVPLLEAASLQEEPSMTEKWAALLANAADPAQRVTVQPGFTEVLRQLTPDEAQVLTFIYTWRTSNDNASSGEHGSLTFSTVSSHFGWENNRMELSIDNLLRLRLFKVKMGGLDSVSDTDSFRRIILTRFGTQFLVAVTPPTT